MLQGTRRGAESRCLQYSWEWLQRALRIKLSQAAQAFEKCVHVSVAAVWTGSSLDVTIKARKPLSCQQPATLEGIVWEP